MTQKQICTTVWHLDVRHVTPKMKSWVFMVYGVSLIDQIRYVVDHLIPRSLGGADNTANLWPQLRAESYAKDIEEVRLSRAVCAGTMSLDAARQQMREWK